MKIQLACADSIVLHGPGMARTVGTLPSDWQDRLQHGKHVLVELEDGRFLFGEPVFNDVGDGACWTMTCQWHVLAARTPLASNLPSIPTGP